MSIIYGPGPASPITPTTLPHTASWWRIRLLPNEDGNYLIQRFDPENPQYSTWFSFEFFDGDNTILDAGLDKPNCKVRFTTDLDRQYLDILHDGPPTKSPKWTPLTAPGWHTHPEGRKLPHWGNR